MRLIVLAIDGLHWGTLTELAARGRLPTVARLFAQGSAAALSFPAPHHAAAHWACIATGLGAAQHGICHPLASRADGLLLDPVRAPDPCRPPFWQQAWEAGLAARVVGWPATLGSVLPPQAPPGSGVVADGFDHPETRAHAFWPLAPDAVVPRGDRALVHAARVHPTQVNPAALDDLLTGLPMPPLRAPAQQLMARWTSAHNLAVHWAEMGDWQLLALRLAGLPEWLAVARMAGVTAPAALQPWCRYLDLMLSRYLAVRGADSRLLLLTAGAEDTGGLLLSGPDVASGRQHQCRAVDVAPTVRALLGLPPCVSAGRNLLAPADASSAGPMPADTAIAERLRAPPDCDAIALAWLAAQGIEAVDLSAMEGRARGVRTASLDAWAEASPQ